MVSHPVDFYILDDGSWLIKDPNAGGWFHVPNLIYFINGYSDEHSVHIAQLDSLQKRAIHKCAIGFEYLKETKDV